MSNEREREREREVEKKRHGKREMREKGRNGR